jgi:hypothetical protein
VPKPKNTRLSVFKGREARLNHAIFQSLALKGPQTIYELHKQIRMQRGQRHTRYASINKRIRVLEENRYLRKAGVKKTKACFEAFTYELTTGAYLIILLSSMDLEELVTLEEAAALTILSTLVFSSRETQDNEPTRKAHPDSANFLLALLLVEFSDTPINYFLEKP